jgi:N-acylneuraminate cytidylyltransferase
MIHKKKVLAIIPARGGSKGLPDKNVMRLAGKPLLAWSIESALNSKFVDHVMVSTEDKRIMEIASVHGADVPFERPAALADDQTPAIDAILHAITFFPSYEIVVKLQPTSPLRTSEDIDAALGRLVEKDAESVISVCPVKHHPNWLKVVSDTGYLLSFDDQPLISNRQQLCPVYALNGAVFAGYRDPLVSRRSFHGKNAIPYLMSAENSFDVDTLMDFQICEMLLDNRLNNE